MNDSIEWETTASPVGKTEPRPQMPPKPDKRWFHEARLGAFIHWGLYALPGGVWQGREAPYLGEWLQSAFRIPNDEYSRLAGQFNPRRFDARKIVGAFAAAGMRYLVFTAKHHDGFAMWHSRVSPFNSYDATPAHRDFVDELSHACQCHGVRLGLYYSHCLDWHEANGGDPRPCADNFGMSWGNDWDFPDKSAKNFDDYFEGKVIPQLTELLSNYGPVAVLWLDCPMNVVAPRHARRIMELVRRLQPNCLVNSRICAMETMGDYGSLGDNQLPAGTASGDFPREAIVTLNDSWGFKATDHHWKSPRQIRETVLDILQSGSNLLVNFGPDGEGSLTMESWKVLKDLSEWQPAVNEVLHSGGQTPFPQDLGWTRAVAADRRLWLFPREPAPDTVTLAGVEGELLSVANAMATRLGTDAWRLEKFRQLALGQAPLRLEFTDAPSYDTCPRLQNGQLTLLPAQAILFHGKDFSDMAAEEDGPLGAAGERLVGAGHCVLSESGALRDWHNPSDHCTWKVRLEPGRYRLRLITRNGAHSADWLGERLVEVTLGNQRLQTSLAADYPLDDSPYYHAAASELGEIMLDMGGEIKVSLRTVQLTSPEAATMLLERLELCSGPLGKDVFGTDGAVPSRRPSNKVNAKPEKIPYKPPEGA